MTLEQQLQKKVVISRTPGYDITSQIEKGNRFIVVDSDIDPNFIPDGYTLIDMKHKGESFKTLIPQSLLFFMANPGEGDADSALDEIAGFYGEAKDFEEDMIGSGQTSVQQANWATLARSSYGTYLVNRLVKHKRGEREDGEPVPEFNESVLKGLDIMDSYVGQRVKAIAAVALGKTADQLNKNEVKDVLKHVTIRENKTEQLSREEFAKITCWAGSHYEIKPEFQNGEDGTSYQIEKRHDKNYMVGVKRTTEVKYDVLNSKVSELEGEIATYRAARHPEGVGKHDSALIRQYINLAYIAKENPRMQLDIQPPAEDKPILETKTSTEAK